jgi:hypothetical protein
LEHLSLEFGNTAVKATGLVLRMADGRHLRCRYELETDETWRFKSLSFAVADSGSGENTRLALARDDGGLGRSTARRRRRSTAVSTWTSR